MPIAVQFDKVGKDFADVVQRVRPLRVARYFGDLPGREVAVDVFDQLLAFLLSCSISAEISTADSFCT